MIMWHVDVTEEGVDVRRTKRTVQEHLVISGIRRYSEFCKGVQDSEFYIHEKETKTLLLEVEIQVNVSRKWQETCRCDTTRVFDCRIEPRMVINGNG